MPFHELGCLLAGGRYQLVERATWRLQSCFKGGSALTKPSTRLCLGDTSPQLLGQGPNMRLLQHACMIARDLVYFQPTGHHTTPPALRVFFNSYPSISRTEENRPPRIQLWHIVAESLVAHHAYISVRERKGLASTPQTLVDHLPKSPRDPLFDAFDPSHSVQQLLSRFHSPHGAQVSADSLERRHHLGTRAIPVEKG